MNEHVIPKKIVYEQERNRVEPVCATCLRACKFIHEVPNVAEVFHCPNYCPQPEYHDKLWNTGHLLFDINYASHFSKEFLKHAKRLHPLKF